MRGVADMKKKSCGWKRQEDEEDFYLTECGDEFVLIEGSVKDNNIIYCPFCGRKVKELK